MFQKIILTSLMFIFQSAFSADYLKVLYIADHFDTCGQQKCLLVRESPEEPYKIWKNTINGFSYQEGFTYCILITISNTDSTTVSYSLNEIKTKIKTGNNDKKLYSNLPDSSIWLLYKLRTKDGSTRTFSVQKAYLQFYNANATFSGNSDCNTISGDFSIKENNIQFNNIASTKMACGKHSIEPDFLMMLNTATTFKITPKLLYITKGKTLLGLFTRKK